MTLGGAGMLRAQRLLVMIAASEGVQEEMKYYWKSRRLRVVAIIYPFPPPTHVHYDAGKIPGFNSGPRDR